MDDIRNVRLARIVLSCEQGERCTCSYVHDAYRAEWTADIFALVTSLFFQYNSCR